MRTMVEIDCVMIEGKPYARLEDVIHSLEVGKSDSEREWAPAYDGIIGFFIDVKREFEKGETP